MWVRRFRLKGLEIAAGADGFMVYDLGLVVPTQQVSTVHTLEIITVRALWYRHSK